MKLHYIDGANKRQAFWYITETAFKANGKDDTFIKLYRLT